MTGTARLRGFCFDSVTLLETFLVAFGLAALAADFSIGSGL